MKRIIAISLLLTLILMSVTTAFEFYGHTKNTTNGALNNTNVSMYVYNFSQPEGFIDPIRTYSGLSNGSGWFNFSVTEDPNSQDLFFKPTIKHFDNNGDLDFIGQILPEFPGFEVSTLSPIDFYLKEGKTLNITAYNASGSPVNFSYVVKDVVLGHPVEHNLDVGPQDLDNEYIVHLPVDRNYSVMVFPDSAMPQSADVDTSTYQEVEFNTSMTPMEMSGNISYNGRTNFSTLSVITYVLEPGNMVYEDGRIPYNVSGFFGRSDEYNNDTGFYNLTVPATVRGSSAMILFVGTVGNQAYGMYQNVTARTGEGDLQNFNISLVEMPGTFTNKFDVEGVMPGSEHNLSLEQFGFQMVDENGTSLTSVEAHVEMEVDYTDIGGPAFTWIANIATDDEGLIELPLLNHKIKKMNIYSFNYAPRERRVTLADLQYDPLNISLKTFNPGGIEDDISDSDIFFDMFKSETTCDVPYPDRAECSLFDAEAVESGFNPLKVVMGGGDISFRMKQNSTNITVHYVNVDMLASGPPDALFDDDSDDTTEASNLEQAWRFGSEGPEIYDYVLVGVPYSESNLEEDAPVTVKIRKLYDDEWNVLWDTEVNGTAGLKSNLSDYEDYDNDWFSTGKTCSESADLTTQSCYINKTRNMIWLHIPHFSGIGPEVNSVAKGNVSIITASSSVTCISNCTVDINVTNGNYTLAQSLHNITINNTDSNGYVSRFNIFWYDGSSFIFNDTNHTRHKDYNLTFYNDSADIHRYRIHINKSNNATTTWTFNYSIDKSTMLSLTTSLVCTENWNCTAWSDEDNSCGTRTCVDLNVCGTTASKPSTSNDCDDDSGSGGGGSGPSGGSVVSTPSTEISKSLTFGQVTKGQNVSFQPNSLKIPVKKISFQSESTFSFMVLSVTAHTEKPEDFEERGNSYQYLEITANNLPDNATDTITVDFSVNKSWVDNNANNPESVYLYKFIVNKWEQMPTVYVDEEDDSYNYEATLTGFSDFVIAAEPKVEQLSNETTVNETEPVVMEVQAEENTTETEEIEEPEEKTNYTPLVIIFLVIALIGAGIFVYLHKKPPKDDKPEEEETEKKEEKTEKKSDKKKEEKKQSKKKSGKKDKSKKDELTEFIDNARGEGYTDEEIKDILKKADWPDDKVEKALKKKHKK